jgi:predicted DNA-binding protein
MLPTPTGIRFPLELKARLDKLAGELGLTRSALVVKLLTESIDAIAPLNLV